MDDFDLDMLEAELDNLTAEQQAELEAEFEALRNSDDWENPFNSKGQPSPRPPNFINKNNGLQAGRASGTKREQRAGANLLKTLINLIYKSLKTNKTFFTLPLDIYPSNAYIRYIR